MPQAERPNPSFFAVEIRDPSRVGFVNANLAQIIGDQGGRVLIPIGGSEYVVVRPVTKRLRNRRDAAGIERYLRGLQGVTGARRIKGDALRRALARKGSREPENDAAGPVARAPSDAELPPDQWNVAAVRAPEAWAKRGAGLADRWWQGSRVGHIDTGYTRHPVFGFEGEAESPFVLADQGIDYVGHNAGGPIDPLDYSGQPGHGTRTSSVLAGDLPHLYLGVAPGVTIIPYRLTESVVIDTLGNDTRLDAAIRHASFDSACDVMSISLGDPCLPRKAVGEAVDAAYDNGKIIVAAAGNITSEVVYPGRFARTVGVGGITRRDKPWTGGSRGERVDICAPADEITRADSRLDDDGAPEYVYGGGGDGTSYATVHVSGAAALWLAYHGRSLEPYDAKPWQRVEAFRRCLKASARTPEGWNTALFGAGILDIAALLDVPLPPPGDLTYNDRKAAGERI